MHARYDRRAPLMHFDVIIVYVFIVSNFVVFHLMRGTTNVIRHITIYPVE